MSDPWGLDSPPAPVPDPLPEVDALASNGWRPLHDAPLYSLLPAAWPAEHRTWVPDRLPRLGMRGATTASYDASVIPVPDEDGDWRYEHVDGAARKAGLPIPPRDRIWLLRSPWPRIPMAVIYRLLWSIIEDRTPDEVAAMYRAALVALRWPEDQAFVACPEPERSLIEQWAAAGRIGEDVGADRRIPPELTAAHRYIAFSQGPDGRRHYTGSDELADPPGTRGRRARRWAHDPDPWINTD